MGTMIWPAVAIGPRPDPAMPPAVLDTYVEAARIANISPRGAAALLRLAVQQLCDELHAEGRDLNAQIGDLVRRGLSPTVQQALDVTRVIRNQALHAGQIDIGEPTITVERLFLAINLIVESLIVQPRHIQALYESLPDDKRGAIERRDQT